MAACDVGLPSASTHSGDQAEIQAGRLRRASGRAATRTPFAVICRAVPPVSARSTWSPTACTSAARSLQVGVGQVRPLALDLGEAARPGGSGPDAGADAGLHVGEHLGVGEQRQVRVEDARLLGARPRAR